MVNLLVIKGNGFYYLVWAVELLSKIAEAGVAAKRRQLIYPFFLTPTVLNHFPTLAIRATVCLHVWRLAGVMPEQVEVAAGFYSFGFGFGWHMVGGHLTKWGWAISRVWAHEFDKGLAYHELGNWARAGGGWVSISRFGACGSGGLGEWILGTESEP